MQFGKQTWIWKGIEINQRGESILMRISKWMFQSGHTEIKMRTDLFIDDLRKIIILKDAKNSMSQSMIPGIHSATSNLQFENLLSNRIITL